ncbi:MAG: hypothetical protein HZC41_02475 [Chloroflexi bacterium]|nr:hypothetical protein [Chloroflexota bacterium]
MSKENTRPSILSTQYSALVLLALIVALALVLRLTALDVIPAGSDGDAAWFGFNALDWLDRGVWPYYVHELYSPEPVTVVLLGLTIPLVGIANVTTRVVSALGGAAFVALLYPAAWWLLADSPRPLRARAGLLAALAAAVSLHVIHVSRTGLQGSQIPMVVALTLLVALTAWAWTCGGFWRWALAGVALALTQYVYLAARVTPLAVLLWVGFTALTQRQQFRQQRRGWLVMAVTAFVLVLPNILFFLTTPEAFAGRASAGTEFSGGLIWNFDTARYGGPLGLVLQKLRRNTLAVAVEWDGPYTSGLDQPILTPLLVVGLLWTVWLLVRQPCRIGLAWPWLAIPVLLIPDLIASVNTQPHAMRQIGVLPFLFLLAGIGLASLWEQLERRTPSGVVRGAIAAGVVLLVLLPSAWDIYRYVFQVTPARYTNPETAWRLQQTDRDIAERLVSQPDKAYLIPATEYERPVLAWIAAGAFRNRRSALSADGTLALPNLPDTVMLMQPADPFRARHDAKAAQVDNRLWVLLYDGRVWFLPPFSAEAANALTCGANSDIQRDRSGTVIARYCAIPPPDSLSAPYTILRRLDVTIGDQLQLVGYDVASDDLIPGQPFFVTLFWKPLRPPHDDYEVFVQLWNDAGESLALWQGKPFNGAYRMPIWRPDEIVPTHHWLTLPPDAPPGRYSLAVGVFDSLRSQTLPASDSGVQADMGILVLPDLRYAPPSTEASVQPLPAAVRFGDALALGGIEARQANTLLSLYQSWMVNPGTVLSVELQWETLQRPAADYSVFLHLTPADDAPPIAQQDRLMGGALPTGAWRAGDEWLDHLELALPPDLPAGVYTLWLGVYYWQTGERLLVIQDGVELPDRRLRLGTVMVE